MTCEADPESVLWSGGCDRVAADIARTDKPTSSSSIAPSSPRTTGTSPARDAPPLCRCCCDPAFDREAALRGTRFVLEPVRVRFTEACTPAYAKRSAEIDERDRALMTIEREGLSHEALIAGALANLTEPIVFLPVPSFWRRC